MSRFLAVCLNPTLQRTIELSRLDMGEVNRATSARLDASGKGVNVSRVLKQLGAEVTHLTHLGPGRDRFLDLCAVDGIQVEWSDATSPVRTCITLLDGSAATTTEIVEPTEYVESDTVKAIRDAFADQLSAREMVVLSGSKAPGYPEDFYAEFCRLARDRGIPVIVDYRGAELERSLLARPRAIKVNLTEFCATFLPGIRATEADDRAALPAVREELARRSLDGVDYVVTRGAREVLWASQGTVGTEPVPAIRPRNTIGSGDAATAGLAFALSAGASLREAVAEGVRCGTENALRLQPGTIL
jgi:1-phosphofructokinase family hexose kinase